MMKSSFLVVIPVIMVLVGCKTEVETATDDATAADASTKAVSKDEVLLANTWTVSCVAPDNGAHDLHLKKGESIQFLEEDARLKVLVAGNDDMSNSSAGWISKNAFIEAKVEKPSVCLTGARYSEVADRMRVSGVMNKVLHKGRGHPVSGTYKHSYTITRYARKDPSDTKPPAGIIAITFSCDGKWDNGNLEDCVDGTHGGVVHASY